ncbi:MAG: rod shape-determining protein MreC, partial [Dysgonamonadaceae bacterium]|nr:rod shape-determining protein MreC [Dysgonamonadaceae bacterium]
MTNSVYSYINLKEDNGILLNKIAELETENYLYRKKIEELESSEQTGRIEIDSVNFLNYRFIPARIAYNTISGPENYLLLNRGSNHGIAPDMGVMSPNGIVGVVVGVSSHYSLVISVLNPSFQLNCKLKNKNYSGPLVWDGKDFRYTYLEN